MRFDGKSLLLADNLCTSKYQTFLATMFMITIPCSVLYADPLELQVQASRTTYPKELDHLNNELSGVSCWPFILPIVQVKLKTHRIFRCLDNNRLLAITIVRHLIHSPTNTEKVSAHQCRQIALHFIIAFYLPLLRFWASIARGNLKWMT